MNSKEIFQVGLGLQVPWEVEEIRLKEGNGVKELEIRIKFQKGSKFNDGEGNESGVYDTVEMRWQHLNFFEHKCYIICKVPRIKGKDGKVITVQVPWSRKGSGFTLLFEAYSMMLIENEMPVNKAAKTMRVNAKRLWTILRHWVGTALSKEDYSDVRLIGIDETSSKKGHKYITVAVDLEKNKVIFVTKGKDETTIESLKKHLENKAVKTEQIERISMDMSKSFISGAIKYFPDACITFDHFHLKKLLNEAFDTVRRAEKRNNNELKNHKYTFLKNENKLTSEQLLAKNNLLENYETLSTAYTLKELFDDFFEFDKTEESQAFLSYWCDLALDSGLLPYAKFVKTINNHWNGIVSYTQAKISNGILESINAKIQLAKKRARGYRNIDNFISVIYLIAAKLDFDFPLQTT